MGIFGDKKKDTDILNLKTKVADLERQNIENVQRMYSIKKNFTETITRPSLASPYMSTDTGAKLPIYTFPLIMIQELERNNDSLRIPIEALMREMFKNGFEIIEKWKYKCLNCSKEFQYKPEPEDDVEESKDQIDTNSEKHGQESDDGDNNSESSANTPESTEGNMSSDTIKSIGFEKSFGWKNTVKPIKILRKDYDDKNLLCDECGSTALRRPDPTHRKVLEMLLKNPVNGNMQTFKEIAYQMELDLDVCDNAYLIILKSYDIDDSTKEIRGERIAEIMRADPPQVAMICDSDGRIGYDDNGNQVYVCPRFEHRNKRLVKPFCDKCGARGLKAVIEVNSVYSIGIPQPKRVVYGEGEVIWKPGKYMPGLVYGFSPIYAIWSKVMALAHMDEYVRKYFDKMRPPRGMLIIASRNYDSFKKSWDVLQQKATEDPYEIYPVMVETDNGGKGMAQWLDFTGSLKELEFVEVRKELRAIIAAMYGVLPLYYGEMPSGWNQEGMQVTITNRVVRWGQEVLKESFFDKIALLVGVDDWDLKLKSGEDTDRLRELQIEGVEIGNAEGMMRMGFTVSRTHQGEFKFSKNPINSPTEGGNGNGDLSSTKTDPKQEQETRHQGEHLSQRPSDVGGMAQGHPASGQGTSESKKSLNTRNKKKDQ